LTVKTNPFGKLSGLVMDISALAH